MAEDRLGNRHSDAWGYVSKHMGMKTALRSPDSMALPDDGPFSSSLRKRGRLPEGVCLDVVSSFGETADIADRILER